MEENSIPMPGDMEMFSKINESITIEELDMAVALMAKHKTDYEKAKAISSEHHAVYQEKRAKLISMLQAAGKTKYSVDCIGTVSITEKLKVRTPKGLDNKKALAAWLLKNLGDDGMHTYLSINYNSLNSLYNQEFESAKENGTAAEFNMPGVDSPDSEFGISFTRR